MLDEKLDKICALNDDIKFTKNLLKTLSESYLIVEDRCGKRMDVTEYKSEFLTDIKERLNDRIEDKYAEIKRIIYEEAMK